VVSGHDALVGVELAILLRQEFQVLVHRALVLARLLVVFDQGKFVLFSSRLVLLLNLGAFDSARLRLASHFLHALLRLNFQLIETGFLVLTRLFILYFGRGSVNLTYFFDFQRNALNWELFQQTVDDSLLCLLLRCEGVRFISIEIRFTTAWDH